MQCENEKCLKWRRIPRIVGKVLEQGRKAVETLVNAGKGIWWDAQDLRNEDENDDDYKYYHRNDEY